MASLDFPQNMDISESESAFSYSIVYPLVAAGHLSFSVAEIASFLLEIFSCKSIWNHPYFKNQSFLQEFAFDHI